MGSEFVEMSDTDFSSTSYLSPERASRRLWCTDWTLMERVLLFFCIFGCLVSIGLMVSVVVLTKNHDKASREYSMSANEHQSEPIDVCTTKTCIQEAAKILSTMNNETDP
jgi:hypothetical protein